MTIDKIKIKDKVFLNADVALKDLENEITLGEMLRSLRKCENLTLEAVSEMIGVNKQFLSAVEHGKKHVGVEFIKHISRILGTAPDSLLEIYFRDILRKHGINMQVKLKKAG